MPAKKPARVLQTPAKAVPGVGHVVQLSVEIQLADEGKKVPEEFRIFAAGVIETTKGLFKFSEKSQKKVIEAAADYGNDLSIDYNHGMFSFFAVDPAEASKAAGWFRPVVRNGELWATRVSWTPKAEQKLKDREFRYISPTFRTSKEGEIEELLNVALTNTPATKKMKPLMASKTGAPAHSPFVEDDEPVTEEAPMEALLAMLGLTANATETEAISKLKALMAHAETAEKLTALSGGKSGAELLGTITAWKTNADLVPALNAQITELQAKEKNAEVLSLITAGKTAKKVTPAMEPMLLKLGAAEGAVALKAFIEAMPVAVPTKAREAGGDNAPTTLSADEAKAMALLGVDPKAYLATKASHGGTVPVVTNEHANEEERAEA